MQKILTFFILSLNFSFTQAATIESGYFNSSTQSLHLTLAYQGGLKAHDFSLVWDECNQTSGQKEIAARIIDTGWDDTGTDFIRRDVSFSLIELACRPSLLTVFSDRHSRITLRIQ